MTVLGTIDSADLGVTLPHEHILNDVTSWWQRTTSVGLDPDEFATSPVTMDLLWDLKHDPFGNRDNCALDDVATATEEVARFAALGGGTIIDPTGLGVGRDLTGLQVVSRATGVNIVAGTGFYLEAAQPDVIADLDAAQIAELIHQIQRRRVQTPCRECGLASQLGTDATGQVVPPLRSPADADGAF